MPNRLQALLFTVLSCESFRRHRDGPAQGRPALNDLDRREAAASSDPAADDIVAELDGPAGAFSPRRSRRRSRRSWSGWRRTGWMTPMRDVRVVTGGNRALRGTVPKGGVVQVSITV
jgi:hypothetical protein